MKITSMVAVVLASSTFLSSIASGETGGNNISNPSVNCLESQRNSDSLVNNIPGVLCDESNNNREVFDNFAESVSKNHNKNEGSHTTMVVEKPVAIVPSNRKDTIKPNSRPSGKANGSSANPKKAETPKIELSKNVVSRKGVVVPDKWVPKINKIGEIYYVKSGGRTLDASSIQRSPRKQASAMRQNIERYGLKAVKETYRNKPAFDQIANAHQANRKNSAKADNAMARVIENQIKNGVYISRHLRDGSMDVSRKTNEPALREAVRNAGCSYFFERDHFHVDLNPNG